MPRERVISPMTYTAVCVVLIVLTILTVGASFIPVYGVWRIVIGLTIALCKASLVVLFFMHAVFSNRVTWSVIAVAGFWLGILLVLTFSDYLTRGMIPNMPGQ
jgi:cytochrome c oxidase subunit IV